MNADSASLPRTADPRDAGVVFDSALAALGSGRGGDALALARRGLALHPRDGRLWLVAGLAWRQLDDLAPAVEALAKAAELAPREPLVAHSLARTSMDAGLPATALFERASALAPADPDVRIGLAAARFAEGEPAAAIESLDAILELNPGWIEGHEAVSRLRWLSGEGERFITSFERALAAVPGDVNLWCELTASWMRADRYDKAIETIARARAATGASRCYDELWMVAHAETGDIETADRLFQAFGGIDEIILATRHMRHLLRAGRPAEASAFADTWEGRDPDNLLTPYQSAAWRLTGDPRWQWLEGDERLIGIYDLADRLPSLSALAERLRGLHFSTCQPLAQSMRGGTQTDGNLFSRVEPEIRALRTLIVEAVETHVSQMPPPRLRASDPARPARADRLCRFLVGPPHRCRLPCGTCSSRRLVQLGLLRLRSGGGSGGRSPCRLAFARGGA